MEQNVNLPLSVRDWPVVVGDRTPGEYYSVSGNWCRNRRGGWACSRGVGHQLPHVASDGYNTLAVWDQQYYGEHRRDRPMHVNDVPTEAFTSSVYRRVAVSIPDDALRR